MAGQTRIAWPDQLLSLPDWDALPQDTSHRFELAEGVLQVVPRPTIAHQRAITRLTTLLDDALPDHLTALAEVEVVLVGTAQETGPATVRVPDVVVVAWEVAQADPARCVAADVLLAVEVLSVGTVRTDRVTKFAEYADAGIPGYWLLDLREGLSLTAYTLLDGAYELTARTAGRLEVSTPVDVRLDLTGLLGRQRPRSARP